MSRNQRLGFLGIAALIAVAAVLLLAGGGGSDDGGEQAATPAAEQTPSATQEAPDEETPTPTPTATPRPQPPLLEAGRERTLTFEEGQTVRFRVRSPGAEEVHVHGYNRTAAIPAGKTVTVAFKATITGIFEIELHGSGEVIGRLKVEPA